MDLLTGLTLLFLLSPPATSLDDCSRFPPASVCLENMQRNRDYRVHLTTQMAWYVGRNQDYYQAHAEACELYWLWDALNAAQGGEGQKDSEYRLKWFRVVRERIGEENWAAGQMPPPVPYRWFTWFP